MSKFIVHDGFSCFTRVRILLTLFAILPIRKQFLKSEDALSAVVDEVLTTATHCYIIQSTDGRVKGFVFRLVNGIGHPKRSAVCQRVWQEIRPCPVVRCMVTRRLRSRNVRRSAERGEQQGRRLVVKRWHLAIWHRIDSLSPHAIFLSLKRTKECHG